MNNNLLILSPDRLPSVIDFAAAHGFNCETQTTHHWKSHFSAHAKKQTAILANPGVLHETEIQSTLIINGPNLNLLGVREPEIYGTDTLAEITNRCISIASTSKCTLDFRQSNHEGEIVTWIQGAPNSDAIVINAGAYTHTSIAIQDALKSYPGLVVELHISNPHQREHFRHHSFITPTADAAAIGLGTKGYDLLIDLICSEANAA